MECLCIMHEAKPYGHLLINGKPIGDDALARMVGAPAEQVSVCMTELREAGVLSMTRSGVVFSRRMIKDDAASKKGAKAITKRWQEVSENKQQSTSPNRYPNSIPITHMPEARIQKKEEVGKPTLVGSVEKPLTDHPAAKEPKPESRFPEFWAAYPKRDGNNSRKDADAKFERLVKSGISPDTIIDGAKRYAAWCDATGKTRTEKVQQATTWLNQNGWENDYVIAAHAAGQPRQSDFGAGRAEPSSNPRFDSARRSAQERAARGWQAADAAVQPGRSDENSDDPRFDVAGSNVIDASNLDRDRRSLREAFAQGFSEDDARSDRRGAEYVARRFVEYR